LIIGAGLAIIVFGMFHMPIAILVDNYFTAEDNMLNEMHIIALFFIIVVVYSAFMGLVIGKLLDVLKKYSKPKGIC